MHERRLRLLLLLLIIAAGGATVATILPDGGGSSARRPSPSSPRTALGLAAASVFVGFNCNGLTTSASDLEVECNDGCKAVSLTTLHVGTDGACPTIPIGERVGIEYVPVSSRDAFGSCAPESGAVRPLVRSDGRVIVGPIVMRAQGNCSGTNPLTVYASGSLWVYDGTGGPKGNTGEVVRLSASTGTVLASAQVPGIWKSVIAADSSGLYLGPGESYGAGDETLYRVAIGANHASALLRLEGPIAWMVGSGDMLDVQVIHDYAAPCADDACELLRFAGLSARANVSSDNLPQHFELGLSPIGDAKVGFFSNVSITSWPNLSADGTEEVIRIDPVTGVMSVVARYRAPTSAFPATLGYESGSVYVLLGGELYRLPVT